MLLSASEIVSSELVITVIYLCRQSVNIWAGLPYTEQQFLNIQNFGQKCSKELIDLIKKWERAAAEASDPINLAKRLGLLETDIEKQLKILGITSSSHIDGSSPSWSLDRHSDIEGQKQRKPLSRIFEEVNFPECILYGHVSIRLRHALDDFEHANGA